MTSPLRSIDTSCGPGRHLRTRRGSLSSKSSARGRSATWVSGSTSAGSTTRCSRPAPCRSTSSKKGSIRGLPARRPPGKVRRPGQRVLSNPPAWLRRRPAFCLTGRISRPGFPSQNKRFRLSTNGATSEFPASRTDQGSRGLPRQRRAGRGCVRAAQDASGGAPGRPGADRHEARLRARGVRHVRGPRGWEAGSLLPLSRPRVCRQTDRHGRGDGVGRRSASSPEGVRRPGSGAMRVLHAGDPPDGEGSARRERESHRRRDQGSARGEPLPVHRLHQDLRGGRAGCSLDAGRERGAPTGNALRHGLRSLRPSARRRNSMSRSRTRVVGRPYPKVDAAAKVTGQTKFADDLFLPRMLHCKLLRSKVAHARLIRVDASKALAAPGVVAVMTGRDLPVSFGILPVSQDEHALATDRVRYVGDPVAAVAAIDEDAAFDALEAIEVEYDPLPPFGTIDDAVARPEPRIHDYGDGGNFHKLVSMEFGDTDKGFADADRVYDDLFFYEGSTHLPLEQHAAVADFGPDGKLTLWSATQTPHYVHRALAKVLQMPASRIRVIATPNGGGFGGKSDPFNHEIVVAHLSRVTGRPVKICLTREEVFYCHRGRHPTLMRVRTGVKKDGAITAMHFQTALDGGGYGSYGVASTYYTGALQTVTYRVPAYRFDGARVFTNKPPCGPKRGHGTPQPRYALEVQLDRIACDLGLDAAEMRKSHLVPPDSVTANFLRVGSMGLGACIDKVVEASGWRERHGKLPFGRGLGLACSSYICGAGLPIYWNSMPQSGVQLKLDRSGGVTVFCGSIDIGRASCRERV